MSSPLSDQADVAGSEDHPLLTRYPGSNIAWYGTEKYFEYDLAFLAPKANNESEDGRKLNRRVELVLRR